MVYEFNPGDPHKSSRPYNYLYDLYTMLLREYHSIHNLPFPLYRPGYEEDVAAHSSLRVVLSEFNGWWWCPYRKLMVRLRTDSPRVSEELGWSDFGNLNFMLHTPHDLWQITSNIQERAQPFALLNYGHSLFRHSIEQAEQDIKQAYIIPDAEMKKAAERQADLPEDYYDEMDTEYSLEEQKEFFASRRSYDEQQEVLWCRQARYSRLRLHWLRMTYESVIEKINAVSEEHNIHQFRRLIKPQEVMDASVCFCRIKKTIDVYDILGDWYATVLYACGASNDDLAEVLGNYPSWSALVKKVMKYRSNVPQE